VNNPWIIRLEAYRTLGFTRKSLEDSDQDIRNEAKEYFKIKKQFEEDPHRMKAEVEAEILRRM